MRRNSFPLVKIILAVLLLAILGAGFFLSMKKEPQVTTVEKPVELKLKPIE